MSGVGPHTEIEIMLSMMPRAFTARGLTAARAFSATASSSGVEINRVSKSITQPKKQGASQAMLNAANVPLDQAQVGISSVWWEGNPCNMHLLDLSMDIKKSVEASGLAGLRFNTIGVSDGISMGTRGMCYSLQSRDIIADSIETVMSAQWYDANISIPGCDKNMPGCLIAMARVNRPSLMIYGGTIRAGCSRGGEPLDIVSAFQAYGEFIAGNIDEEKRSDIVSNACPGAGACGGMYTANTMASAIEAMGMALPFSSCAPAESEHKRAECAGAGAAIRLLLERNICPSDIMTREAFENAMTVVMATGGSTNAVLHLLAMARAIGVTLDLEDFQRTSERVPFIADMKPSGRFVMEDLHAAGGVPALMKMLLEEGYLHGDCLTVTGNTVAENMAHVPSLKEGQEVIVPVSKPIKETAHLQILRGNVAPGGSVAKITGKEGLFFEGSALVFEQEEDMLDALERGEIGKGSVIIIRYEGPKGGPGMPEMLTCTSAIMGAGLGNDVAMLTDGRFSGGSHGFIVGHITPEAADGGPIALIENGDTIRIDMADAKSSDGCGGVIDLVGVSDAEMDARRAAWVKPPPAASSGTLFKYIKCVGSASEGCVTDA